VIVEVYLFLRASFSSHKHTKRNRLSSFDTFRMSCLLVEMPADAVVPASRIEETKTRMISMSLMGSIVAVLGEPNI